MKIIIGGAGIGGLTAGIALQQAGHDIVIYEREAELRAVGAGLTLWANAIHALDKIGVGDAIQAYGAMSGDGGIHSMTGQGIMVTDTQSIEQQVGTPNIVIHRADLQSILLDNFDGVIHYAKSLSEYQQSNDQVCVQFSDGTQAGCDVLIAADGIHSAIRQQMFHESKPIYAGYTAYRSIVDFDHARVGSMWGESWGYGNRFGVTPLPNDRIYWFATANTPEHQITPLGIRQQTLLEIFCNWHDPIADLIRNTPEDKILQHGIYVIEPLKSWREGRVILMGDAAHAMTPNLGQGACQAIEDAVVLGQVFQHTTDVNAALSQYQQERLSRANTILKQSQMIGTIGQIENRLLANLRNMAFRYMPESMRERNLMNVISYQV